MMRQPARARIELAIAEARILEHHRGRIRRRRDLRRKQLRQRGGRDRPRGVVPVAQDGAALIGAENVEAADRRGPASATAASSSRTSRAAIASTLAARTGRWRIPHCPRSPPARRPRRAARPGSPTGRTWRSRSRPARTRSQPRQLEPHRRVVLQHQHHLEQRMPRQRARRVDAPRPAARTAGPGGCRPPGCSPAPARSARGSSDCPTVSVRSTSVLTKKPDEIVERAVGAARNRAADRDVAAAAQPREQAASPACSTMNRLAPLSRASPSRPPCSSGIERQPHAVAAMARHRRPRPVARQLDLIGKPGERSRQNASWRAIALSHRPPQPSTSCCHSV